MRILICDDKPLATEQLSNHINRLGHQVVAAAQTDQQAFELTEQFKPDLAIFISSTHIRIKTYIQLLKNVLSHPIIIACSKHIAIDLVLSDLDSSIQVKTIQQPELKALLSPLYEFGCLQLHVIAPANKGTMQNNNTQPREFIITKTYRGIESIAVSDIYYFLADQKYVMVRHRNGNVLIDETLKDLEAEFSDQFIRIHRNALVSLTQLDALELVAAGQYQVSFQNLDEKLAVSRRHLPHLRQKVQRV